MSEKGQNRIAEHRKRKGMTQQQLADALDIHWMTVSKLERGKMQITEAWLGRIAAALKVPLEDLINPGRQSREILVRGRIEGGLTVIHDPPGGHYVEMIDEGHDLVTNWFFVKGRDLEPFYFDGDAIRFTYYYSGDYPQLLGRLAVVTFDIEADRDQEVFAVLEEYVGDYRYNLRSIKGIRFENVRVSEIGIVSSLMIKPPEEKAKSDKNNTPKSA